MNRKILALATVLTISIKLDAYRQCHGYAKWSHDDPASTFTKFIARGKNSEVCIAIVKSPELLLEQSRKSCHENFPSRQPLMIEGEHYSQLRNDYKNKNFRQAFWTWEKNAKVHFYADFDATKVLCRRVYARSNKLSFDGAENTAALKEKCSTPRGYVCQYPFLYNCAWHVHVTEAKDGENVKIEKKIFYAQHSDFDHGKSCGVGNLPTEVIDEVIVALKRCKYPGFEAEWSQWSSCSATCTDPFANSPRRSRQRVVTQKCAETLILPIFKFLALYDRETCNAHVLCPNLNITTFTWAPTSTNPDMTEESDEPEETVDPDPEHENDKSRDVNGQSTASQKSASIYVTVAIVIILLILAVAIVTLAVIFIKRKKSSKTAGNQKSEISPDISKENTVGVSTAKTIRVHPTSQHPSVFTMKSTKTGKSTKISDVSCLSLPPLSANQDIYTMIGKKKDAEKSTISRKQ